ncbi:MAG: LysR family transcriptional regulator [Clostridiales bacterium]|nr:LysR family transcriptional regulator [Clostridiales bacterium]
MEQNLGLYHVFHTVAKNGNISRAAKELYTSQPAISKSIRKLEENLHTVLFKRTSRGVSLTLEGELLFRHTTEAFAALDSGEKILARHHSLGIAQLRIGVSTTLCKYILLPYLQRFIQAYPHVQISISNQSTYQTLALLEENKIDIGLVGEPSSPKEYYFHPLQKIQDTFVATKSYLEHLKLRSEPMDLYRTATFMMLDEENITRQYVNRVFLEHGIELSHVLEVSTMDLLIEFARIGLGAACVIREFVQEELSRNELVELPAVLPFAPRQIGFVCRKGEQQEYVIRNFLSI